MEATSLVRTLNFMEEQGWIKRKKDKSDGRKVLITLTPKGKLKRDISRKAVKEFNEAISKRLSSKKLQVFNEVIAEINAIAEERKAIKIES